MKSLSFFMSAALVTVIMLLIYGTVQQCYRTGLNDPQIQIARDIARQLEQGKPVETSFANDPFDITRSLLPFIVIYDAQGKPLRSNALLDGKMPQVPVGVFEEVRKKGEHDVSWQPRKTVRMAMVIVKTNTAPLQFVAAGRSMAEVEYRIGNMSTMIFTGWIICLAIIAITAAFNSYKRTN